MDERNILVVAHARRDDTVSAAVRVIEALHTAGARAVMSIEDLRDLSESLGDTTALRPVYLLGEQVAPAALELAIVLGGDGTILRAAELVREGSAPVVGINMGHVGFLAEGERDNLDEAVRRVIARDYTVEERMALSIRVKNEQNDTVYETFALNEASIEKGDRERMLEVVIEVDGRPLTSYGCDGVVVSTPTGSTAYNFSAGGPIIWPNVQAISVVPLSAHALFARPIVIDPASWVAIEVMERSAGNGVLWADGRRSRELPPGARVVVQRSVKPVRLARLHTAVFTDRLVNKFRLPVDGWRGPDPATGMMRALRGDR
ncbi:NAD kinase [Microbacterium gorillae]|uniref:NAD kinase n=1 Tax=Microbacterium gorillae TaxID=1231063 RepID=UPI003899138D